MDESADIEPLALTERAHGRSWRRDAPPPRRLSGWSAKRVLRRVAGECGAWVVVLAVVLVLLAPALGFAATSGWAVYTYAHTLVALWQHVKSYQLSDLAPLLDTLDRAARIGLASAGYFALLSALIVLMAGLLGRRWRRLYLLPGIAFTFPSALAFFYGIQLTLDIRAPQVSISPPLRVALLAYLLLDTIVLAAALVDVSPRKRRARPARALTGRRRHTPSAPLALVRFGPSAPLANDDDWLFPVAASVSRDPATDTHPLGAGYQYVGNTIPLAAAAETTAQVRAAATPPSAGPADTLIPAQAPGNAEGGMDLRVSRSPRVKGNMRAPTWRSTWRPTWRPTWSKPALSRFRERLIPPARWVAQARTLAQAVSARAGAGLQSLRRHATLFRHGQPDELVSDLRGDHRADMPLDQR